MKDKANSRTALIELKLCFVPVLLLVSILGCKLQDGGRYSDNGFRLCKTFEDKPFVLKEWEYLGVISITDGYLVSASDFRKGRRIDLIVNYGHTQDMHGIFRKISKSLKENHPSTWEFLPTSFAKIHLDASEDSLTMINSIDLSKFEILIDGKPGIYQWESKRTDGLLFKYLPINDLRIPIIKVKIDRFNEYMAVDPLDDGIEKYYCSPSYQFLDSAKYMKVAVL